MPTATAERVIWLTPKQAAGHLEISASTLARWMADTSIPFSRQGRIVRFNAAALDKWMKGRAQ